MHDDGASEHRNSGSFGLQSSGNLGNFEEHRLFGIHSRVSQEEMNNTIMKEIKKKREMSWDKKNVSIPETERWKCVTI